MYSMIIEMSGTLYSLNVLIFIIQYHMKSIWFVYIVGACASDKVL